MPANRILAAFALSGAIAAVIGTWSGVRPASGQTQPEDPAEHAPRTAQEQKDLSHFMRLKLKASGQILEGLAVEDYGLIQTGARQLNRMSQAEKWRVSNDPIYRQFSSDFQRITEMLVEAAEKNNLDQAALKWMDATMSCIECHRYARGMMIAGGGRP